MFDSATAEQITSRLSSGEPMAQICRTPGMPCVTTVWNWQQENPTFAESIARAREIGYDVIAADCLRIADTQELGEIVKNGPDGTTVTREDMLGHRRLRIESRLKLLAKWDPKRYGDRIQQDVDLTVRVQIADPTRQLRNAATTQQVSAQGAATLTALEHSGQVSTLTVGALVQAKPKEDP